MSSIALLNLLGTAKHTRALPFLAHIACQISAGSNTSPNLYLVMCVRMLLPLPFSSFSLAASSSCAAPAFLLSDAQGHGGFKAKPMPDYPSMVHDGVAPVNHRPQTIPIPFKGQMYLDNPKPPLAEQNDDSSVVRGFKARPYPVQIFNTVTKGVGVAQLKVALVYILLTAKLICVL